MKLNDREGVNNDLNNCCLYRIMYILSAYFFFGKKVQLLRFFLLHEMRSLKI